MKRDKKLWLIKQNKGVSLVELIIVIGIMAVLTGVVVLSLDVIPKSRVKACSQKIVSKMEGTRTDALSFYNAEVKIYCTSDGVYADTILYKDASTASTVTEKIGNAGVSVAFLTNESGAAYVTLQTGDYLIFSFSRSSGSFKYLKGTVGGSSVAASVYCKDLKVSSGSIAREVELVPLTGKVYIK